MQSKHFTSKVKLLKSPYRGLFMFLFIQIKLKLYKKLPAYLQSNESQRFYGSDKMKQGEGRHF